MRWWWCLLVVGCREPMGPRPGPLDPQAPSKLDALLARVVDDRGDVDYDALRAERETLDAYVRWIGRPSALDGKQGQQAHAFWLSAFNALVLYQVLERDVRGSVNEVPSGLPWDGARFWYGTAFVVAGEPMSLWELGHERITHTTQDYRDFAALAVAARSGPPMRAGLYAAADLDAALDQQAHAFLQSDRGVRFEGDRPLFNPVFDRYDDEFALYTAGLDPCAIAALHTTGERHDRLVRAAEQGCPHGYFAFDWSLNRSAP